MLTSAYRFHSIHPLLYPVKILKNNERIEILEYYAKAKSDIHTIYSNDWICVELDAKVDDIICIKSPSGSIYRKVIEKKE